MTYNVFGGTLNLTQQPTEDMPVSSKSCLTVLIWFFLGLPGHCFVVFGSVIISLLCGSVF